MFRWQRTIHSLLAAACAAVLVASADPGAAWAEGTIRGFGEVYEGDVDAFLSSKVSVNAWLDDDGVAHGKISYVGDVEFTPGDPQGIGYPADPWIMEVTTIYFYTDHAALVAGIVTHSPDPSAMGSETSFVFIDNRGTDEPDTIDDIPIDAGNIIVEEK